VFIAGLLTGGAGSRSGDPLRTQNLALRVHRRSPDRRRRQQVRRPAANLKPGGPGTWHHKTQKRSAITSARPSIA